MNQTKDLKNKMKRRAAPTPVEETFANTEALEKKITIRCTETLHKKIRVYAVQRGTTVQELITDFLEKLE